MKNVLLVVGLAAFTAVAADPPVQDKPVDKARRPSANTYTDSEKAGTDFKLQGEYIGTTPDGVKVAAQIVADGDGQFSGRMLRGGLPGDGWDEKTQIKFKGKADDGKLNYDFALPNGTMVHCVAAEEKIKATGDDGKAVEFQREVRHSRTEGAKPPAGAVVLFDGTNADAWDHGKIVNGLLSVAVAGGQTSKQKFGDCTVHAEFILPFMPKARGQARANSGVYLQGRYEVQVLDSFGLEGKDNECGGIYTLHAPKVNMCYPPLQWQTYDIDFTAPRFSDGKKTADARITVKQNGVLIQDNVDVKHDTAGGVLKEGPEPGPLHLQNHGNPVFFRNVWVVEKK